MNVSAGTSGSMTKRLPPGQREKILENDIATCANHDYLLVSEIGMILDRPVLFFVACP